MSKPYSVLINIYKRVFPLSKFIAKWSHEENREEHLRKQVKALVPNHLRYAELLGARLQVNEEQYD
jgi:hypothetical protein